MWRSKFMRVCICVSVCVCVRRTRAASSFSIQFASLNHHGTISFRKVAMALGVKRHSTDNYDCKALEDLELSSNARPFSVKALLGRRGAQGGARRCHALGPRVEVGAPGRRAGCEGIRWFQKKRKTNSVRGVPCSTSMKAEPQKRRKPK